MGFVPPVGAGVYGFSELSTPFAARHLDPQHGRGAQHAQHAQQRSPFHADEGEGGRVAR